MSETLRIENDTYPDGSAVRRLIFGNTLLGSYTLESGGFLPLRKRKPRATEFDAILDIIADHHRAAIKQLEWLDSARDAAFRQQHEFKGQK